MDVARLLIVDDEENLRSSLCQAFRMEGYEVTGAADAQEALSLIQGATFDVLLSDLMMPGLDGLSLLEKARVLLPEAVIILMTGQATVESAIRALKGGAYDYILKPFKLEEVFHVMGRGLEQQRLRRENLALAEINRRLTEIDQIKSDLLSAITHEFRTPLTIIYGWMDLLLTGQFGDLAGGTREGVEAIGHSARRLGRLIANLLAYVEFERQEAAFQDQVVDLGEILRTTATQLAAEYAEKRVRVEFPGGPRETRPSLRQPGGERHQVQSGRGADPAGRVGGGRRGHRLHHQHLRPDPPGAPLPRLRALHPGGHDPHARGGRPGAGPLGGPGDRRGARGEHRALPG
ncbi:MAG: response regulator [candidate division NC10 bacterium]|nr:response regulator [candidate division NC10 bacterium]